MINREKITRFVKFLIWSLIPLILIGFFLLWKEVLNQPLNLYAIVATSIFSVFMIIFVGILLLMVIRYNEYIGIDDDQLRINWRHICQDYKKFLIFQRWFGISFGFVILLMPIVQFLIEDKIENWFIIPIGFILLLINIKELNIFKNKERK